MEIKEENIYGAIGEFALQLDGYCAAATVPYDDEVRDRFFDDFTKYFYIAKDKLLIRTQLFMLQRWFARNASCIDSLDSEYVLYMFLYLHLYRSELPEFLGREPYYSAWKALPKSQKEDTAECFRRKLCLMREERIKRKYRSEGM